MGYNNRQSSNRLTALAFLALAAAAVMLMITLNLSEARSALSSGIISVSDVSPSDEEYREPTAEEIMLENAKGIVSAMTDEEKAGQLLLIRSNGLSESEFISLAAECKAGGVVLFAEDTEGRTAESLRQFTAGLQTACGGRLLICVDEEGGSVVRVSSNKNLRSSPFRSPQSIYDAGGMEAIRADAAEKSDFLLSFGINVNFAPVADVVTSRGGFLYKRAFGEGAQETADYVSEVTAVMKQRGIGCTIKHFPGYGNSSGDTHNGLVRVDTPPNEIKERELLPFAAGIAAGADSVMVTHTIISAIDAERPATLSPSVISLLREELGFEGVVISDAMDMGAIKKYSGGRDACVAAFLAGIDLLCTPADAKEAYNSLLTAITDGTIPRERLDESVTRIILWKQSLGLYEISG